MSRVVPRVTLRPPRPQGSQQTYFELRMVLSAWAGPRATLVHPTAASTTRLTEQVAETHESSVEMEMQRTGDPSSRKMAGMSCIADCARRAMKIALMWSCAHVDTAAVDTASTAAFAKAFLGWHCVPSRCCDSLSCSEAARSARHNTHTLWSRMQMSREEVWVGQRHVFR